MPKKNGEPTKAEHRARRAAYNAALADGRVLCIKGSDGFPSSWRSFNTHDDMNVYAAMLKRSQILFEVVKFPA